MIEVAAEQLEEIKICEREAKKAERQLSDWTERLVRLQNSAEQARQKYRECLAELQKRKEGD